MNKQTLQQVIKQALKVDQPKWIERMATCATIGIPSSSPIVQFLQEGAILAGGAVRDMECHPMGLIGALLANTIRDFDLFFPSREKALDAAWRMVSAGNMGKRKEVYVHQSEFALTFIDVPLQTFPTNENEYCFPRDVQLIWRCSFEGTADLLDQFDFTVTQFAMWMDEDGRIHIGYYDTALEDAKFRRLVYTGRTECQFSTLHRTQKYFQRGYKMKKRMMASIVGDIMKKYNPDTVAENVEQDMYEDTID